MSIKIGATILIITAGVAGGYLIVKNSSPAAITDKSQDNSIENEKLIPSGNPLKWVEKAVGGLSDIFEKSPEENKTASETNSLDNLTELVAKTMFTQMKKMDQGGENLTEIDINDAKSREFIENALAELQNPSLLFNSAGINEKDLKVLNNNSLDARRKYLKTAGEIILNNSNDFYNNPQKALTGFADRLDISGFIQIADAYSKIFNGFLNMEIPSDYLDIHKRYLVLLKKAETVYRGIIDYNKDPLKAALSTQLIPKINEAELQIKLEYLHKVTLLPKK